MGQLIKLNPWVHRTVEGFGVFNLVIGTTLLFYYPKTPFAIVSPSIPQPLWATVFLSSGILIFYGLFKMNLYFLRYMMIFGLFLKVMWEIGLLYRLTNGGGVISVELWGMIAYLQFLAVIYFNPESYGTQ